jgi:hypothetical protein
VANVSRALTEAKRRECPRDEGKCRETEKKSGKCREIVVQRNVIAGECDSVCVWIAAECRIEKNWMVKGGDPLLVWRVRIR